MAACMAAAITGCGGGDGASGPGAQLKWYTGVAGSGSFEKLAEECNKGANGRWTINNVDLSRSTDQSREILVRRLAAEDPDIDLMNMDVIWTPEFAEAGWLLPVTGESLKQATEGTLKGPLTTATWKGKLVGIPLASNVQQLWYRKDRVPKPPETWDEMIAMAKKLPKDQGLMQEQGARYEGLVVWFNSLVRSGGGEITDEEGNPTLDETAVDAARIIRDFARSGRADPSLSNNMEDQGRLAFESGNSAFMLNWPYVYASAKAAAETSPEVKKVFDNMAWAPYPSVKKGMPSRTSIGGNTLGISKFTRYPKGGDRGGALHGQRGEPDHQRHARGAPACRVQALR
jgi:multiple sugar transport system substrate-binding protein